MKILHIVALGLFIASFNRLDASEVIVSWAQMVQDLRARTSDDMHMLYFGSQENTLARRLKAQPPKIPGVRLVFADPAEAFENPLTGRMVKGTRLMDMFAAKAGTIVILGPDGIQEPSLRLPQAIHNNDLSIVGFYAEYASKDHFKALPLADFARAIDREDILGAIQKNAELGNLATPIPESATMPLMIAPSGEPIRPQHTPNTFFIVGLRDSRALRAQVNEIGIGFRAIAPPIMVVLPPDIDASWFEDRPFPVTVIRAKTEWITSDVRPRTYLFAADKSGALMRGFRSIDVLSVTLGLPPGHPVPFNVAIPIGEVDE